MNDESKTGSDEAPDQEGRWAKAKEAGHDAADALRGEAHRIGEEVRAMAEEKARRQQRHVAGVIRDCGTIFHDAADDLRQDGDHVAATLMDLASAKLAQGSQSLEHTDTNDLAAGMKRAIKENPEITLSALFGAGILLGGLVQSVSEDGAQAEGNSPHDHQQNAPPGVPTNDDPGEPSRAHEHIGGS